MLRDEDKSYMTYITYAWPAVLEQIEFMIWRRLDGQRFVYPRPIWRRRAQRLPTRAVITRQYFNKEQDLTDDTLFPLPQVMLVNTINYRCPEFAINTPACLHDDATFVCDFGTNNPVWNFTVGSQRTYPATTLNTPDPNDASMCEIATDWPDSLIIDVQQKPYKGGYVVETVEIFNPVNC